MQFVFDWDEEKSNNIDSASFDYIWFFLSQLRTNYSFRAFQAKESFGAQNKVSIHEKLVLRSVVWSLFLFVLTDSILLNLNLQKRTLNKFVFLTVSTFVQQIWRKYSNIGRVFFVLQWWKKQIRKTRFYGVKWFFSRGCGTR